jgi:serine phosphatase RsbU (regulator of sigma subunit)
MIYRYGILVFFILLSTFAKAKDYKSLLNIAQELYKSNPDSSYSLYLQLEEELSAEKENEVLIAQAKAGQIKYLVLKTKFDDAVSLIREVLPVFEKNNKYDDVANCYSLSSIIATKIDEKDDAIKYSNLAYEFYTKANNSNGQIKVLTNQSFFFNKFSMFDSAHATLNKLFAFEIKMKPSQRFYLYQNFGLYYIGINNNISAIENIKKAIPIAEKENMLDSRVTVYTLIAKPYINLKEFTSAEYYLTKSINLAKEHHLIFELNEAYNELIRLYEMKGDFKNAFLTKKINDTIKEEIFNLEKINKIKEYESQLQLTEKEKLIAEKDLSLKKEQLNNIEAKSKITTLFLIVFICFLLIVFVVIIFYRARKLNREINIQKTLVEEKNKEITSSITYAKRIQNAILPPDNFIEEILPQNFVLYLPKDIVAGDFYWMETTSGEWREGDENPPHRTHHSTHILFAAADCTGHGVPGAMVSVVCNNALNRAVREFNLIQPSAILEKVSFLVEETFEKSVNEVKDGMDVALCLFNPSTLELQYAGANNSLYIIRNNELIELKADRQPVGKHFKKKPFTNHSFQLNKDDTIYLFTDGFADQFGGPKGKKFMYKPFKDLLLKSSTLAISEQKKFIENTFIDWKRDLEQMDDICIIGIKI